MARLVRRPNKTGLDFTTTEGRNAYQRDYYAKHREKMCKNAVRRYRLRKGLPLTEAGK